MVVSVMEPKLLMKMLHVTFTGGPARNNQRHLHHHHPPRLRRPTKEKSEAKINSLKLCCHFQYTTSSVVHLSTTAEKLPAKYFTKRLSSFIECPLVTLRVFIDNQLGFTCSASRTSWGCGAAMKYGCCSGFLRSRVEDG